ncbi:polyprenyl diphosphate synthase [Breznakiella homolactica]|uniref:Isoprenyl transferase n=1 Tax=Breznakiella homolactica TaxID=2798577 RepID=A0A7T7XKL5_9SPIR|nr:polyprenyl diphosphate synthase [Breznakiella homolactica]QQO08086.1 di-trans,poly-cis-decaprenylcistransferase [Breznakiella homolactica]
MASSEPKSGGHPVPAHVGIIMDGNGRWAKKRNQIRTQGHLEGLKAAKKAVQAAADLGIRYLSLYVFSTENWKRTAEEVNYIMGLVKQYLKAELNFFRKNRIKILHAGDMDTLPPDIAREIRDVCEDTRDFEGLTVILALNYGGRDEIVRAVRRMLRNGPVNPENLTQELIGKNLDNPEVPDPDLIIRTGGEFRTSNFLLWETAYSEYYISDKLWPDWTKKDFEKAVMEFQKRERRFGGVNK